MNSTTHRRGRQQGFTIVEALLVGILLAVVVAIAFPSFISFTQNVKFEGAALSIASDLRLAQSLVVSRGQRYQLLFSGNALTGGSAARRPDLCAQFERKAKKHQ
jgi:type IV fimbrial biogenesis protein FimT